MIEQRRRLPFEGAVNFRDLGGYRSADGRRVKWRQLYRSDALVHLTDADLSAASDLHLRNLFDLRSVAERTKRPDRELPSATAVHPIGFLPYRNEELFKRVIGNTISPVELRTLFSQSYGRFALEPAFARMFDVLLQPDAFPALIHCTSGKDRTGFAVALVLRVLGVPRDVIIEDFMLSNSHRPDLSFFIGACDPEIADITGSVEADYLETAFAGTVTHWGSEEAYFRDGLGLTEERRQQFCDRLLEPDA